MEKENKMVENLNNYIYTIYIYVIYLFIFY